MKIKYHIDYRSHDSLFGNIFRQHDTESLEELEDFINNLADCYHVTKKYKTFSLEESDYFQLKTFIPSQNVISCYHQCDKSNEELLKFYIKENRKKYQEVILQIVEDIL
jgi:uncharacterized protein YfkK (UPF0435 family)